MKKKNTSNIGGQAVLEGVMMRGPSSIATAVRDTNGKILIESERFVPADKKPKIYRVPIIRGAISFFSSMVIGIKTLNRSSTVFGEDLTDDPSKFEKWLAKTFKIDIMNVLIGIAMIMGILLAIGIFVVIPQFATTGIFNLANWSTSTETMNLSTQFGMNVAYNLVAGAIRIAIFVGYIALISRMKDIHRLFQYHGAEHKTISCFENGLELNPKNAQKFTTQHDRCGTTFMFIVMIVSVLFFSIFPIEILLGADGIVKVLLRIVTRIVLIPVVAGISYELLKLFAKYDNKFVRICKAPGLWLQKLTTQPPEDDMLEVAIAAFSEVMELEADKDRPLQKFDAKFDAEKLVSILSNIVSVKNECEIIAMFVLNANSKTELYDGRIADNKQKEQAITLAKRRKKGAPLQYILGEAPFFGYIFKTDSRALIPRFDTEILVEKAIKIIKDNNSEEDISNYKVWDLCTGSGVIAISIKKNCAVDMFASDLSSNAIELANENAQKLKTEINFACGSLFKVAKGKKFDMIVCNPPYIQTGAVSELDNEVFEYEPVVALDGGADGFDFYRDIVSKADNYLNENGYLIFEVGQGQSEYVKELMSEKYEVEIINDYNNPPIPRVILGKIKI
ncbi:MAG: peptide chain release factor N(5)-glutamine methyltransferase [Clostridia bacterium]